MWSYIQGLWIMADRFKHSSNMRAFRLFYLWAVEFSRSFLGHRIIFPDYYMDASSLAYMTFYIRPP